MALKISPCGCYSRISWHSWRISLQHQNSFAGLEPGWLVGGCPTKQSISSIAIAHYSSTRSMMMVCSRESLTIEMKPRCIQRSNASTQPIRSEEHTSELQSLMRNSYAVFCLQKKNNTKSH